MAYELRWTAYSKDDYRRLDASERIVVDKGLARIQERGMEAGQPLSGALAGCRKIKHRKLGLRIVFRELEGRIEVMEIVAIGKRADGAVYRHATTRIDL